MPSPHAPGSTVRSVDRAVERRLVVAVERHLPPAGPTHDESRGRPLHANMNVHSSPSEGTQTAAHSPAGSLTDGSQRPMTM